MRFVLKLVFSNILVAAFALFLAFYRQISSPAAQVITQTQTFLSFLVLFAILVIFLVFIFTVGMKMVRNTTDFLILFEKDRAQLSTFSPEKKAKVGVEILNWPYSASKITGILGLIGSGFGLLLPRMMNLPEIPISAYLSLLIDFLVVVVMTVFLTFFFNSLFIPSMLSRLEEAGFPLPDFSDPRIHHFGIRLKFSFTIIFIIFLVLYFFSTDVFRRLDLLSAAGKIDEGLIRPVRLGVVKSTLLVGIYAAIIIVFASRPLAINISRLSQGVRKIARGALEEDPLLKPVSADELGDITAAVDRMREALNHQIGQAVKQSEKMESVFRTIREILPLLASLTEEMRRISQEQEAGAAEQSETIRKVQAGVEDLSVVAREISDGSTQVMEKAAAALRDGEEGTNTIEFFRKSIDNLTERAGEVAERIQTLSLVGEEVEKILKLIEGIANKSDILALNAALEGAKAGEAGTGFMLIADNMRRLAEMIVKEADQVRPILRQIETSSSEIMGAIESNLSETKVGSGLMIQAHGAFENIYRAIQKANDTVYGILQGTSQQEALTLKIIEQATRVAEIAKAGAELSRISTQTSERLVEISNRLKSLLASEASTS